MTTIAPKVRVDDSTLAVTFDRFDIPSYELFLKVKRLPEYQIDFDPETANYTVTAPARFAPILGVPLPAKPPTDLPISEFLFDDQRAAVLMALAAKRFAVWFDTGLGKTNIFLEWARHVAHKTGGRVLIVTLANLINQTCEEAQKFYGDSLPLVRLTTKAAMREWCEKGTLHGAPAVGIGIVNYEKFNPEGKTGKDQIISEVRHLSGIAIDESSRLAMGGGKQKWAIIHSTKGIPYKLSCTATPAPNATMEFASQASFLERMRSEGEIIWTYFTRDPKTHRWGVKKHAKAAFFEFMASWSIYVRDPRRFGWRMNMKEVPKPQIIIHEIPTTAEQKQIAASLAIDASGQMSLFNDRDTNTIERAKLSQIAKGFRYTKDKAQRIQLIPSLKPDHIARIVGTDAGAKHQGGLDLQVLIWTVFDAESDLIAKALDRRGITYELLTGSVPKKHRIDMLERFRTGQSRVLISRAVMLGFGMNFQHCGSMIFSGWSDSYVQWYQAIRRAYRYGQTKKLRVHVPVIRSLEGQMLDNIGGKETRHETEIAEMEANYLLAMKATGILGAQVLPKRKGKAA